MTRLHPFSFLLVFLPCFAAWSQTLRDVPLTLDSLTVSCPGSPPTTLSELPAQVPIFYDWSTGETTIEGEHRITRLGPGSFQVQTLATVFNDYLFGARGYGCHFYYGASFEVPGGRRQGTTAVLFTHALGNRDFVRASSNLEARHLFSDQLGLFVGFRAPEDLPTFFTPEDLPDAPPYAMTESMNLLAGDSISVEPGFTWNLDHYTFLKIPPRGTHEIDQTYLLWVRFAPTMPGRGSPP